MDRLGRYLNPLMPPFSPTQSSRELKTFGYLLRKYPQKGYLHVYRTAPFVSIMLYRSHYLLFSGPAILHLLSSKPVVKILSLD